MAKAYVLDDEAPEADTQPDPVEQEFNDALAELNALTVRFEATKAQQAKWRIKFQIERKKAIESMRRAVIAFDKQKAEMKPATPPKIPLSITRSVAAMTPPADAIRVEDKTSANGTSSTSLQLDFGAKPGSHHAKLTKSKSALVLHSPAHRTSSRMLAGTPEHGKVGGTPSLRTSTNISELDELEGVHDETTTVGDQTTARSIFTPAAPAQSKVSVDLRPVHGDVSESELSAREESPTRADERSMTYSAIREIDENSYRLPLSRNRSTPQLLVDPVKSRSQTSTPASRRTGRLVHRATAMDLDEMRRLTERTFQRQLAYSREGARASNK